MTNYDCIQGFYEFLKVDKTPIEVHWSNSSKLGMAKCIHNIVFTAIKHVI
jgi:hypothetical protein